MISIKEVVRDPSIQINLNSFFFHTLETCNKNKKEREKNETHIHKSLTPHCPLRDAKAFLFVALPILLIFAQNTQIFLLVRKKRDIQNKTKAITT